MSKLTIEDAIEAVVRERFSNDSVDSVHVTHDVDDEGDRILKIVIVISGSFNAIDKQKMLGLVRHIRSETVNLKESGFPIVDFITSGDAAKIRR